MATNIKQYEILIENALYLAEDTGSEKVFLFMNSDSSCNTLLTEEHRRSNKIVLVHLKIKN